MKDPYFRLQPTMFMFSYQGSESSTSEGILKVTPWISLNVSQFFTT
jgi:hypothetical protein